MDIPRRDHAKSYRERQIHDFIYVWNLKKKKKNEQIREQKQIHRYREQTDGHQKRR